MIEKLTHVPIVVSDQEKALKFYTEVLGCEKRADSQNPGNRRWLTVAPKGTDVELILFEGKYKLDPRAPPEAGSGGNHFVFFFFQAEDGIRDLTVTGVQTCALPI